MTRNYLDILAETIRNNWNLPALSDFYLTEDGKAQDTSRGNHYTYGEMYTEIVRVTDLLTNLGLQKGDHIAICGANSSHWVIAYLAIAKMHGVSVTVMHSLQLEEITHLITRSNAKALFVDNDMWKDLKENSLQHVQNVIALDDWQILLGENKMISQFKPSKSDLRIEFCPVTPDELAMICFTSGSTGKSKGVMLSYRNISNNVRNVDEIFPKSGNNLYMVTLSVAHMYSLSLEVLGQLCRGKSLLILNAASPIGVMGVIDKNPPYMLCTVPAVLEGVRRANAGHQLHILEKLEHIQIGGAKMDAEVERLLKDNKINISVGYGTSETAPLIAMCSAPIYRNHSVGKIVSGMTAHIAPNGEILVKGENVMLGYYKDPEATAMKIDADGWLHTGDRGHLDEDGYLYVEGRLEQDIIVLPNGENIRPDNIEALINALPEVSESIVLARDGKLIAIVVPKAPIDRIAILRAINPQLPLFSQLYDVEITDQPLARTEKQTLKRYLYK